jgi:hypothetical protein
MNEARRTVESYRALGRKGWQTRQENDERVAGNLPADLLPLWERVRHQLKGSGVDQRTEAFLQYAHEHESDALQALIEDAEEKLAASIAKRYAHDAASFSTEVPF